MKILTFIIVYMISTCGWTQPLFHGPITIENRGASDLIISDMTRDEHQDILLGTGAIAINQWDEKTTFALSSTQITHGEADVAIAEIDGQNGIDIAWVGGKVFIGVNQGGVPPTFVESEIWTGPLGSSGISMGDLTNDGEIDIVSSGDKGPMYETHWIIVFENQGTSPPTFVKHDLPDSDFSQACVAISDLNHDGKLDIIATSGIGITWRENITTNTLAFNKIQIPSSTSSIYWFHKPIPVDFNNDGDMDILVNTKAEVMWFENMGGSKPSFVQHVIYTDFTGGNQADKYTTSNICQVKPIDYNLDGKTDVLLTGRKLILLENVGDDRTFTTHEFPLTVYTVALDVGKLDYDEYPDFVVSTYDAGYGTTLVYLNRSAAPTSARSNWQIYN